MAPAQADLALRLLVAFALTFGLGFERQLRGSSAGDRTFALIGVSTAVIGVLSEKGAPNALAGAVTGVGFIGAGLTFRESIKDHQVLRGITTGAAILAAAAIGAAAGEGYFLVAVVATALVLLVLEIRYLPALRHLDARRWQGYVRSDEEDEESDGPNFDGK
ncbi:MAG: MgtC/SapB family protein [Pseudonocardia sp.]|jgi:putative Mg2+ transporter-C (MgtC) family protein|nr:MgtC/SapB family protein [Pseudonocardia sp.]